MQTLTAPAPHLCPPAFVPGNDPVSADQMLYRLARFFRQYLHCTPEQLAVLSLWTVHTHCIAAAHATPYLSIGSVQKQSGRTLCLRLLSLVCVHPWYVSGPRAGVLIRKVAAERPTVLLDECQAVFAASERRIRGLIVSGSQRGTPCELSSGPADVFCPKAFAGMRILPPAIADRSIPLVLSAAPPDGTISRFTVEKAREEAAPLVQWLKDWSAENLSALAKVEPLRHSQMPSQLNSRQQDYIEPLLHISGAIGGQVPEQARYSLVKLFERDSEHGCFVRLLQDINAIFRKQGTHNVPTSVLLHSLNSMKDRPWSRWDNGSPMNPMDLAGILRPLGITPQSIRITSAVTAKGYVSRDFVPLWEHHRNANDPVLDSKAGAVTSGTIRHVLPRD